MAAEFTEHTWADDIDGDWGDYETKDQQACEEGSFPENYLFDLGLGHQRYRCPATRKDQGLRLCLRRYTRTPI